MPMGKGTYGTKKGRPPKKKNGNGPKVKRRGNRNGIIN